ncbi:MAG TPA: hypothetical protein VMZ49_11625 [Patescibacteria group bacterium]|nr:hypothetical protein [Patescibacteria group bacterium]
MSSIFSVHSLVRNFLYDGKQYEEVKITWFLLERSSPLAAYETAILDYGQLSEKERAFPEEYVNEQFSREEAEALKNYLDRRPDMSTRIEEIELPVSPNASGCRRLPRGNGSDFFILHREAGYSLPFKVEGYFSVRFAELKVNGDDRATVVNKRP